MFLQIRMHMLIIESQFLNGTFFLDFYLPETKNRIIFSKFITTGIYILLLFLVPQIVELVGVSYILYTPDLQVSSILLLISLFIALFYSFFFYVYALTNKFSRISILNRYLAVIFIPILIILFRYPEVGEFFEIRITNKCIFITILFIIFFIVSYFFAIQKKDMDIS
jgi:hypothetical protein